MKLQENYKLDNPFTGLDQIDSKRLYEVISCASAQIVELLSNKEVEILEANTSGKICFCIKDHTYFEWSIYWEVQFDMYEVLYFISELHTHLKSEEVIELWKRNIWHWSEQYLNNCDFETLNYL